MAVLETKNLKFVYSIGTPFEACAIKGVNFSADANEIIGIIGHTGSGKSTFIQHLNGLIKPTDGIVCVNGEDIWKKENKADLRKVKFAVGLCFQYPEYQIFEDTVFDEIAFGPKQMGLDTDEIQSRVFESMNIVGLDRKLKDASPFDMSGGQKRRVAIASIIAMKPQVLVLDEPCAGLDPKGRQVILNLVKNYQKKMGNTVLFVSHSMEDVANIADRVMVFKGGEVAMFGAVDEVFSRGAELKEMGLNIPEVTEVFLKLKAMGIDCNTGVYTVDQAVKEIKRLKSEGESSYAF